MLDPLIPILQQHLPTWRNQPISFAQLSGGITNQNFKVTVGEAGTDHYVVRICAPGVAIHGIERANERRCAHAAAAAGITPSLIGFIDNLPDQRQAFITRFIPGTTLSPAEVRHVDHLAAVTQLVQRVHRLPEFAGRFDVFRIFDQGLAFARQHGAALPSFVDHVAAEIARIEGALQRHPPPLTPCHNDLLPTNLLCGDDGQLWLIDWEYAGWGDPFFDLGNLSVNNEFGDEEEQALLINYFGQVTERDWARLKLMKIVSDAREGIWGAVQSIISTLAVDYADYCQRHLARFMANAASPEVARWLSEV